MKEVRTRFAPSPTGFLHVGGVRTALFAWLVARQNNGLFILRIEDTDQAREVQGSADHIQESLQWLGLDWDRGPGKDGDCGPYFQSQRLGIYKEWAQKLVDKGRAYADPYTPEEVQAFRDKAIAEKRPFLFRDHRPENPPAWDGTKPLRLMSEPKSYEWHDEVLGDLKTGPEVVDDFILMKSDGYPTYNFAHIVDDHLMKITHVIRSQEFLASVPKYLNLYEALEIERPLLATAPFVMGPDGKKKLSKRDGAKDILDYGREGYLPDALVSFMATLGWNDGSEQEVFTRDELISKFKLDRVQRSGAHFDERRLLWANGHFIRALPLDVLFAKVKDFWPNESETYDDNYKKRTLGLVQERMKYFAELPDLTKFFFKDLPVNPSLWQDNKQLKKLDPTEVKSLLETAKSSLEQSDFSTDNLKERLNTLLASTGQKPAVLFGLIRIATTQSPASPGLADTLAVLGKEVSLRRIDNMLAVL
ncbi:MAG TPA: glutamate--tRNA ligase [Candidatus Saccharimonadales bacterium]|nr:glutamate--tRNA ligase [Candidatus Saccharimonadales bacterium]